MITVSLCAMLFTTVPMIGSYVGLILCDRMDGLKAGMHSAALRLASAFALLGASCGPLNAAAEGFFPRDFGGLKLVDVVGIHRSKCVLSPKNKHEVRKMVILSGQPTSVFVGLRISLAMPLALQHWCCAAHLLCIINDLNALISPVLQCDRHVFGPAFLQFHGQSLSGGFSHGLLRLGPKRAAVWGFAGLLGHHGGGASADRHLRARAKELGDPHVAVGGGRLDGQRCQLWVVSEADLHGTTMTYGKRDKMGKSKWWAAWMLQVKDWNLKQKRDANTLR